MIQCGKDATGFSHDRAWECWQTDKQIDRCYQTYCSAIWDHETQRRISNLLHDGKYRKFAIALSQLSGPFWIVKIGPLLRELWLFSCSIWVVWKGAFLLKWAPPVINVFIIVCSSENSLLALLMWHHRPAWLNLPKLEKLLIWGKGPFSHYYDEPTPLYDRWRGTKVLITVGTYECSSWGNFNSL